ncbi:MAG: type I-F CRISPR-associated protein Csy1 [Candidatus Thiodiazotropha sp. (ex Dulcina madagascariensis)]|nr:type I-F CRISPR-associated protein Csy1 [Candidatus Thiodiazotropha sp. (ex Dulcina madagascariensis)]
METPTNEPSSDSTQLRAAISQFIQERLQPKLEKLKEDDDEKRQQLLESHRPENWIADAARRVGQIQQVTHAIKYAHPDAKGTSLSSRGNDAAGETLVGTHTLKGSGASDVVGNAAALDLLKFLRLEVDGKDLLERAIAADPALAAALPGDTEQAQAWMASFAGLSEPKGTPATHKLAKQLYWPVEEDEYHLLAPLFPTSLVHRVWRTIREDRFSEAAKSAREARRNNLPHDHGIREYPDFAILNFGGTKPQNISQLNSERHGEAYLLASTPPNWQNQPPQPPLKVESIFERRFGHRRAVRRLTGTLRRFLASTRDWNNIAVRDKRDELLALIIDELLQFAAELQELSPGWSARPECALNQEECFWLDPRRVLDDEAFATLRITTNWRGPVCHRFGNWLNARLNTDKTPMGDAEHKTWKGLLDKELRMLREALDSDE